MFSIWIAPTGPVTSTRPDTIRVGSASRCDTRPPMLACWSGRRAVFRFLCILLCPMGIGYSTSCPSLTDLLGVCAGVTREGINGTFPGSEFPTPSEVRLIPPFLVLLICKFRICIFGYPSSFPVRPQPHYLTKVGRMSFVSLPSGNTVVPCLPTGQFYVKYGPLHSKRACG